MGWAGGDINMPQQPSYGESMRDAMQAQIDLGPEYYEAEAEYRPKYAQLETGILGQTLLGKGGMEEFQDRGLLDLMGAPAQRYATGGVGEPEPDPVAAQFAQGYAGGQAPPDDEIRIQPTPAPRAGGGWSSGGGIQTPPRAGGGGFLDDWFEGKEGARGSVTNPYPQRGTPEYDAMIAEDRADPSKAAGWATLDRGQAALREAGAGGGAEGMRAYREKIRAEGRGFAAPQPAAAQPFIGEGQDQRVRRPAIRGEGYRDVPGLGNVYAPTQEQQNLLMADTEAQRGGRLPQALMQDVMLGPISAARARANVAAAQPTPAQGGSVLEQMRRPGMGDIDEFTGQEGFGGLAQYGADIAEYGAGRQRAADIRDVGMYGREATRALRQADPLSEMMLGRMAGIAGQEMGGAAQGRFDDPLLEAMRGQSGLELARGDLGYGGLLGEMGTQAMTGLQAGDELTARERSRAVQESRQAMEARGRQLDPLAAVNELEALERARSARRQERRGFAGQVQQAEEQRRGTGRQYAANLLAMEGARRGEARGYGQQVLGTSRQMAADPFMAILGRPSGAGQQIAQQGLGAAQYGLSAGPGVVFNPEAGLTYMLGQQGQQAGLAAAQAGAKGSMIGGLLGMGGSLGAAKIMACWVAREVYGESNPKWLQFRHWMLNKAPDWFREWYLANGESVAEHIKDKPELKARIKIFMDSKLEA